VVTDYIIFGGLMLVVLIAGILIIRKEITKEVTRQRTILETILETLAGIFE